MELAIKNLAYKILIISEMSILPLILAMISSYYIYKWVQDRYKHKLKFIIKFYWIPLIISFILFLLCYFFDFSSTKLIETIEYEAFAIENLSHIPHLKYLLLSFQPLIYAIVYAIAGISTMYIDSVNPNRNSEIIKKREIKKARLDKVDNIDFSYNYNVFVVGKSGAGKTTALANFLESHIKNQEFTVVMDGKGDISKYSIYEIVTKLCIKYNRKIYIINQTISDETHAYNPFIGCTSTQIKDMLINMGEWSEEHYKALSSEYYQAMAQFMIDFDQKIDFTNLIKFCDSSYFQKMIDIYRESISEADYRYYLGVISSAGGTVSASRSRFSTIANGVGKMLFAETPYTFNIMSAFEEKAVVLVLLNNLEYTDYAKSVGHLVLNDIKNTLGHITKIKGFHEDFLCVYDEVSSYFDPMLVDIVNKSRSLGGANIIASQTIPDMDVINEMTRRQIIGNMHGFLMLKTSDDLTAEALANAIGTKTESDISTQFDKYGKTGLGSTKLSERFIVHPNDLKNLPLGVGIWIDTRKTPVRRYQIKIPFVILDDIPDYVFEPL